MQTNQHEQTIPWTEDSTSLQSLASGGYGAHFSSRITSTQPRTFLAIPVQLFAAYPPFSRFEVSAAQTFPMRSRLKSAGAGGTTPLTAKEASASTQAAKCKLIWFQDLQILIITRELSISSISYML